MLNQSFNSSPQPLDGGLPNRQKSTLLGQLLRGVLSLWVRSQLDDVHNLDCWIGEGDRPIEQGVIPQIQVNGVQVVYQGLHFTRVEVSGENIPLDFSGVLRGQPLQVRNPFPVHLQLELTNADLWNSLQTPLFQSAVQNTVGALFSQLMGQPTHATTVSKDTSKTTLLPQIQSLRVQDQGLVLGHDTLMLRLLAEFLQHPPLPLTLTTALAIHPNHSLIFRRSHWHFDPQLDPRDPALPSERTQPLPMVPSRLFTLKDTSLDLGPDVTLHSLTLTPEKLIFLATLLVQPPR